MVETAEIGMLFISRYYIIYTLMLQPCHSATLSFCNTVVLQYCRSAILSFCNTVILSAAKNPHRGCFLPSLDLLQVVSCVILSAAKNPHRGGREILRCAQNDIFHFLHHAQNDTAVPF